MGFGIKEAQINQNFQISVGPTQTPITALIVLWGKKPNDRFQTQISKKRQKIASEKGELVGGEGPRVGWGRERGPLGTVEMLGRVVIYTWQTMIGWEWKTFILVVPLLLSTTKP